ncbi:MAG: hypothetical protein ACYCXW_22480, partial [Solirubrobacteraceae bacterium]
MTFSHASQTSHLEISNGLPFGFGSLTGSSRIITVDHQASPPGLTGTGRARFKIANPATNKGLE